MLSFSIKDSIFHVHMIGKSCYKQEKRFCVFNRKFGTPVEKWTQRFQYATFGSNVESSDSVLGPLTLSEPVGGGLN